MFSSHFKIGYGQPLTMKLTFTAHFQPIFDVLKNIFAK